MNYPGLGYGWGALLVLECRVVFLFAWWRVCVLGRWFKLLEVIRSSVVG